MVWFTAAEGRRIADGLGLSEAVFKRRYARKIDGGWSLTEHRTEHGMDCVFLDRESVPGQAVCGIYENRPAQCRAWPFWPENLRTRRAWESTKRDTPCPGMDRGAFVPIEAIRIQRDATQKT